MNECIFFIQIVVLIAFGLGALRLGKDVLAAWVCMQALIANLFVLKQISLFGLDVTASDAFAIGSLLGLNMIQENFTREDAQKTTWACFFCMLFFAVVSQLHLLFIPNAQDYTQTAFETLLSPAPRLFLASLTVFFVVQQFDLRFFAKIKAAFPSLSFPMRTAIALVVSQLLDTVLFSFLGLYGIVSSIIDIMVLSFLIKVVVISCTTTLLRIVKA